MITVSGEGWQASLARHQDLAELQTLYSPWTLKMLYAVPYRVSKAVSQIPAARAVDYLARSGTQPIAAGLGPIRPSHVYHDTIW